MQGKIPVLEKSVSWPGRSGSPWGVYGRLKTSHRDNLEQAAAAVLLLLRWGNWPPAAAATGHQLQLATPRPTAGLIAGCFLRNKVMRNISLTAPVVYCHQCIMHPDRAQFTMLICCCFMSLQLRVAVVTVQLSTMCKYSISLIAHSVCDTAFESVICPPSSLIWFDLDLV